MTVKSLPFDHGEGVSAQRSHDNAHVYRKSVSAQRATESDKKHRPRRTAASRREQQNRSNARMIARLIGGLTSIQRHRGNQLSRTGKALLSALGSGKGFPDEVAPASFGGAQRSHDAPISRICRHWAIGRCTWGSRCNFLHDYGYAPNGYGNEMELDGDNSSGSNVSDDSLDDRLSQATTNATYNGYEHDCNHDDNNHRYGYDDEQQLQHDVDDYVYDNNGWTTQNNFEEDDYDYHYNHREERVDNNLQVAHDDHDAKNKEQQVYCYEDDVDHIINILNLLDDDDATHALAQLPGGLFDEVLARRAQRWRQNQHTDRDAISQQLATARTHINSTLKNLDDAISAHTRYDNSKPLDATTARDDATRCDDAPSSNACDKESDDDCIPRLFYPENGTYEDGQLSLTSVFTHNDSLALYEERQSDHKLRCRIFDCLQTLNYNKKIARRVFGKELHEALRFAVPSVQNKLDDCNDGKLSEEGFHRLATSCSEAMLEPALSDDFHRAGTNCPVVDSQQRQKAPPLIELVRETLTCLQGQQRQLAIDALPLDLRQMIESDYEVRDESTEHSDDEHEG